MAWLKKYYFLFFPIFYIPAIFNFFSGDDWYHLLISQASSLKEVTHFFYFARPFQQATFYRPLSNQLFFFSFQKIFGLNPLPYYIFGLILFSVTLYLIYTLSKELWNNKLFPILTVIIYAFSVSNFPRVYFLSALQEYFLVIFVLLTLLSHLKKNTLLATTFFILALFSKETAVVLPPLIFLIDWLKKNINFKRYFAYSAILLVYLYFRFFVMHVPQEEAYIWNFSPLKMANTFAWYSLWSIGAPELLIDYISSGFRPIPRFFSDYPLWWKVIIIPLLTLLASAGFLLLKQLKKIDKKFIFFCGFFLTSLAPLLLLPQHKFALEQGLPLVGFSMAVAWLLKILSKKWLMLFLVVYISYNLSMNWLTFTRHYTVTRSKVSRNVFEYFKNDYPIAPQNSYFYFKNDLPRYGDNLEETKQLPYALSYSDFFKVFYHDKTFKVFYEDYGDLPPQNNLQQIPINSLQFFK